MLYKAASNLQLRKILGFFFVSGLTAENTTPSSLTVRWDPVQTVKRGETIEYLLQRQCVGKDQDFVQVSCL